MGIGKNICHQLKNVRRSIAEENGIPLEIEECTYKGECSGTCPKCEAEVRYLESELAKRISLGKAATIAGLAVGLAAGTAQAQAPVKPSVVPDTSSRVVEPLAGEVMAPDPVFVNVDEPPTFPGGDEALKKFIEDSIRYPRIAAEQNIGGMVIVTFTVETDGSIHNPRLLNDVGAGCGEEALRLVSIMPKWNPGKMKGHIVRVQYEQTIFFDRDKYGIPLLMGKPAVKPENEPKPERPLQGMPAPSNNFFPDGANQIIETQGTKIIVK
jgi:TonB family protein